MQQLGWVGCAFTSLLLFGLWGFWGGIAASTTNARSVLFYSSIGSLVAGLLCLGMLHFKPALSVRGVGFGMLTGLASGLGTLFFVLAIERGRTLPVVFITALYPMVTTVLVCLFFSQPLSLKQIAGVLFSLIAIYLLV